MAKVVIVFSTLCSLVAVFGAPGSNCPPGGTYFDKHLGQYGRWQCCSEICKPMIFKDMCQKKCPNYHQDKTMPKPLADTSSAKEDDPSHVVTVISVVVPVALLLTIVVVAVFGLVKRGWFKRARQQENVPEGSAMLREIPQDRLPGDTTSLHHDDLTDIDAGRDNATVQAAGSRSSGISSFGQSENNLPSLRSQQQGDSSGDYQTAKEAGIPVQVEDSSGGAVAVH